MNRICVVRIIPPTLQMTRIRSVNSLSRPVTRAVQCAGKLHMQTNGRFCFQHCGKHIHGISFTQCRFSSASSRIPKKFQRKLLPYEVEMDKNQDIILYTYREKDKFYKLMTFGGVFMFLVLLNAADLITTLRKDTKPQNMEEVPWFAWWRKVNLASHKSSLASFFIFIALVYLAGILFWPTRMIREITLLKGGEKILFETRRPFGRFKQVEVPLKDVSANWVDDRGQYLWVTFRPKRFPCAIDTEGHIPDRGLLDSTIGQKRF